MLDSLRDVGARVPRRRLPLRPDGPPHQGEPAEGAASSIPELLLYGEGWSFGEVADDRAVRRGERSATWPGPGSRRSATACATPSAAAARTTPTRATRASPAGLADTPSAALEHAQEEVMRGLAGSADTIAYVDAHDNETLFDALALKLPQATSMDDRVRMNTLALATVTLSQSPASGTRAPSCCARSRSTATPTTAATGSTASTGPRRTRRSAPGCRRAGTTRRAGSTCGRC